MKLVKLKIFDIDKLYSIAYKAYNTLVPPSLPPIPPDVNPFDIIHSIWNRHRENSENRIYFIRWLEREGIISLNGDEFNRLIGGGTARAIKEVFDDLMIQYTAHQRGIDDDLTDILRI